MSESMTMSNIDHRVVARRDHGGWLLAMGLLSLPFLIMILALHGLKDIYQTFHYTDETEYHYPVIVIRSSSSSCGPSRVRISLIMLRRPRLCFIWWPPGSASSSTVRCRLCD